MSQALIVDDDRTERRVIAGLLKNRLNITPLETADGEEALRLLRKNEEIKLIILDLEMPVMGGLEALKIIRHDHSHIPVIVLTGSTNIKDAVQAMQAGAVDFLSKPLEAERLNTSARNALKLSLMSREIRRLKRKDEGALTFADLIGHDRSLAESVKIGKKAAFCDLPVLITGETGTGKELFAGAIHGESARAGNPFIAINCGAIPEKLVESTLFGHEKGAFTGAVNRTDGKFREANGGTILLDEVGELPMEAQVKLLRVLQQQEVEPVGAGRSVPVDVRIISATNKNLARQVKEGHFREDLYFRLNVLHIDLLPLRARKPDIPVMALHFMESFCASHQAMPKEFSDRAMAKLKSYSWPGNARELRNVINSAMALNEGDILEPDHFRFTSDTSIHAPDKNVITPLQPDGTFKSFKTLEQEIIALALEHHHNNISRTARTLGLAKSTLYAKLGTMADLKSA